MWSNGENTPPPRKGHGFKLQLKIEHNIIIFG
jgi:hypothetical protein